MSEQEQSSQPAPVRRRTLLQRMAALVGLSAFSGGAPAAAAAAALPAVPKGWPAQAGPARLPTLTTAEENDPKVREYFAQMEGPGGRKGGTKLNLVLTLARYPELAMRYHQFGMHVINFSSLSPRLREIVTVRTAWLWRSDYEWTKHVAAAKRHGVTDAEIERIRDGSFGGTLSPLERHALRATDQLHANVAIDDRTWAALATELSEKQLLDLLFTVGSYAMLAMVINGARIQNES
jgi:alkylhydroperoxidase family enzyme